MHGNMNIKKRYGTNCWFNDQFVFSEIGSTLYVQRYEFNTPPSHSYLSLCEGFKAKAYWLW